MLCSLSPWSLYLLNAPGEGLTPPPPYYPRLERSLERLSNLPMVTQLVPAG